MRLIAVLLLGTGLFAAVEGLWIPAKAVLAQVLMRSAWERTVAGESRVRPWPWADTWPVARLRVPRLEVDQIVLAGANGGTLAFGPGHLSGTPAPGTEGNTILSGHRDTHFAFLEELRPGDELVLETRRGDRRYRVSSSQIIDSRTHSLVARSEGSELTLVTCFPFRAVMPGGSLRYVVVASGFAEEGRRALLR